MAGLRVEFTLEIYPQKVQQLVDSAEGPVGRYNKILAEAVLREAIPRIGTRYAGHHSGTRLRETGRVENIGGAAYMVRFNHPIAYLHHVGAQPHTISPSRATGMGRKGPLPVTSGPPVATKRRGAHFEGFWSKTTVNHPGSPANPYLTDAAAQIGLKPSGALLRGTRLTPLFRSKGFF